jgi:hypothetical protein
MAVFIFSRSSACCARTAHMYMRASQRGDEMLGPRLLDEVMETLVSVFSGLLMDGSCEDWLIDGGFIFWGC